MNDEEYLKQISGGINPGGKSKFSFMSSTIFKVSMGGIIAFIVLAIIGAILSGGRVDTKTKAIRLRLRLENTADVISDYQDDIRSPALRAHGASLKSVLSSTDNEVNEYLAEKYDYKSGKEDKKLKDEAAQNKEALENALFDGKINGVLDRIFVSEMSYEISLLIADETSIYNSADNSLKVIMKTSLDSLRKLSETFESYSNN